jgi:hypothetical protein
VTRFLDGPAKGQCLMLKRAARFLRVTECAGKWDALDFPEDQPLARETLHAYEIAGQPGWCFMRPGGRFVMAEYRHVPNQPSDATMRTLDTWREWCVEQARLNPQSATGNPQ